ncbi:plastocyanin/azurin family copper-binding protein [Haladaptatus salinisoli]|uniref:plastocyanin/azurin family copper-binding protein n=1 Tax=Haladaptatus salinisoli TaxID=2884876 RepID=UPI001D09CEB9|nr:plastocyanin/azurin family copper-binding protein [Haladaptatus salinisoli]
MNHDLDRRTFLTVTGATLTGATLAGCLSSANPGGTNAETSTTTTTTEPDATVKVGPGGTYTFEPAEVTIPPGGTIEWIWESDIHNIVVETQPKNANWTGSPGDPAKTYDTGFSFTHTFETQGRYEYYCQPHLAAGMTGEVEVTDSPTKTETHTESEEEGEQTASEEPRTVTDLTGRSEITVAVGPNGDLLFEPKAAKISRDTTVTWKWESDLHNVVPETQPQGANWKGAPGGKTKTYDSGYTYSHTFTTPGTYEYFCQPHKAARMTGTLVVE